MRLIDADELRDRVGYIEYEYGHINEEIDKMPTIEAEPIRHGKWIWVEDVPLEDGETEYDREAWYQCSECEAYDLRIKDCHADFCWSCGAKMDLKEVEE